MKRRYALILIASLLLVLTLGGGNVQTLAMDATGLQPQAGAWRTGGPFDDHGHPARITAVAVSPHYPDDDTIFAIGAMGDDYGSIYRSHDRGQHWQEVLHPAPPDAFSGGWFRHIVLAATGAGDEATLTIYASYNGNLSPTAQAAPDAPYARLYRSTDGGDTWEIALAGMQVGPLAISPAYDADHTLFAQINGLLRRSVDGGQTWQALDIPSETYPIDIFRLAISPAFASDHTIFAVGYGPTYRSTDAGQTWDALGGYGPAYGLAVSPAFAADGTLWTGYRLIEGIGDGTPESGVVRYSNGGDAWALANVGLPDTYEPYPASLAASPNYASDQSVFTALRGQFVGWEQRSLFRSFNGGNNWVHLGPAPGNPDVFDLAATHAADEGLTAHLATEAGVWHYGGLCEERLVNGGFETEGGWAFPITPRPGAYSVALAHSGHRSLRAGILSGTDVYSYSSARQTITLPAGAAHISLSLWWYPISEEGSAVLAPPPDFWPDEVAAVGPAAAAANDAQYILLLDDQGKIVRRLLYTRSDSQTWQRLEFDLTGLAGRTLQLHIGVFNNGNGKRTALFADDASLTVCWPQPPSAWVYLPMLWQQHAWSWPTPTPTPTATPTPTPTPTPITCYNGVNDGGFETNAAWLIKDNPVLAAYVTTPVHSGARAMRTGIAPGGANLRSYSPIEQTITIPAGLQSAQLHFWRYRTWGDGSGVGSAALPPIAELPAYESQLPDAIFATDFFYVIAIRQDGSIVWLLVERANDPAWRAAMLDLSSLRGQTVRLQFGTYNNGTDGRSATYVDDVELRLCPPPEALVLADGWAQRVIGRPDSATVYADTGDALYRSNDAGATWSRPSAGGVFAQLPVAHAILGNAPYVLYAGEGYPCYMGGPPTAMWRSTDAGVTWQLLPAGQNLKPLAAHPTQPWVYAAGCDGPYLSQDGGTSWQHQPDPLFSLYDIAHMAPLGPNWDEVWASGISEGGGGVVLVSRDSGDTWAMSTPMFADIGWIGGLRASRFTTDTVYVGTVYDFLLTTDDGITWPSQSVGLDDVIDVARIADRSYGLFDIAEAPTDPQHRLYLGTIRGLYSRDPVTHVWSKQTGQAYDAWRIDDLLILDAAPQQMFVTSEHGVFRFGPIL